MLWCYLSALLFLAAGPLRAQGQPDTVRWISFAALEDSLAVRPKPIFIDFYTDWCTYCRKMDRVVFTDPAVVATLNAKYYAVRFNAESTTAVDFGGRTYVNDQVGQSRRPLHLVAQLLATREGRFSAPALVFLDASFRVRERHFRYLGPRGFLEVLEEGG